MSDEDPPPPTAEEGILVLSYLGLELTDAEAGVFREAWPRAHNWDSRDLVTEATDIYIDCLPEACSFPMPAAESVMRSGIVCDALSGRRGRELYRRIGQARQEGRLLSELLRPRKRYRL